jgi:hypothetical protein
VKPKTEIETTKIKKFHEAQKKMADRKRGTATTTIKIVITGRPALPGLPGIAALPRGGMAGRRLPRHSAIARHWKPTTCTNFEKT